MRRPFEEIIVIGAGTSGLLLSLLLAKHGVPVRILEASDRLAEQPRAAFYGPACVPDLRRAGVLEEARENGYTPARVCWRRFDDYGPITALEMSALGGGLKWDADVKPFCLPQGELATVMLEHFLDGHGGEISWGHKVVGMGQDGRRAWVDVETPGGAEKIYADYIVGCDGAASAVRKGLFGDEFPGWAWDSQIVSVDIYYDFPKYGFTDINFVLHPEHFFLASPIRRDGMYRVFYGEASGLTTEEVLARQPSKLETILPGHPKPDEYRIVSSANYSMQQRCAPSLREGRFLLCGDAAHLCNPWGGLDVTGGLIDAGGLYDCLAGIWDSRVATGEGEGGDEDGDEDSILDLYSDERIHKWRMVINPVSQANFRRMSDPDPATVLERDEWLQLCKRAEADEGFARGLILGSMRLRYDFTQHYMH